MADTDLNIAIYEASQGNIQVLLDQETIWLSQRQLQWATSTLKEHLTRGYTINQQRFEQNAQELEAAPKLVRKAAASPQLQADTGRGLVEIISRYTQTFLWLSGTGPFINFPMTLNLRSP
ncbi:hypothetical protein ACTL6P_22575 [Endozoicomonas acroporae]|uniref:hypothetical protein n=1 Tax=Endozoicomonas acroporae TaxID=1701104 RepID=UPI001C609590|nr:hypothetical protein [Endozoicomonas acroporae]